jgi:DNA-binding transcriptional LysR family regulator
MDWSNLEYFLSVAREGSLSKAASKLDVNHSTVARRLDKLELDLNVKLFNRYNKGYELTSHGLALKQEAIVVENQVFQIKRVFQSKEAELSGTLTVTKPMNGGVNMTSLFCDFKAQYPDIDIFLKSASANSDLSSQEADLSIQLTNSPPDNLVGKKIGRLPINIYGSSEYLKSLKNMDLDELEWVIWVDESNNLDMESFIRKNIGEPKIIFKTNVYNEVFDYMSAGIGVSLISSFGLPPVHNLKRFMPDKYIFEQDLWLLYHPDVRGSAKINVFKKFLISNLDKYTNLAGIN